MLEETAVGTVNYPRRCDWNAVDAILYFYWATDRCRDLVSYEKNIRKRLWEPFVIMNASPDLLMKTADIYKVPPSVRIVVDYPWL